MYLEPFNATIAVLDKIEEGGHQIKEDIDSNDAATIKKAHGESKEGYCKRVILCAMERVRYGNIFDDMDNY